MSIARLLGAVLGLVVGLLFYLGHRLDHTLINLLLRSLCGPDQYIQLKQELRNWLILPGALGGCLPSALWCFIAASLCGEWRWRVHADRTISLAWLCPLINATWEMVQWLHWTDGRADARDVIAGCIGWLIAEAVFFRSAKQIELRARWNWRVGVALSGFACMAFADVWK